MSERTQKPRRPVKVKSAPPAKLLRFIEELSWTLKRYSDIDFKSSARELETLAKQGEVVARSAAAQVELQEFGPVDPNKMVLVGVLPGMFTDESLFPSNEDIAEFAENVLEVTIPRWSKKSKFELIGHIVCNTSSADDEKLFQIANALRKIASHEHNAKEIIQKGRANKKNWNEIIQELIEG